MAGVAGAKRECGRRKIRRRSKRKTRKTKTGFLCLNPKKKKQKKRQKRKYNS